MYYFFLIRLTIFFQEILLKIYSTFSSSFLPTSLSNHHHHHHHYPPHSSISSKKDLLCKANKLSILLLLYSKPRSFSSFSKKTTKNSLHFLFSSFFTTTSTPYTPVSSIRIPSTATTLTFSRIFPSSSLSHNLACCCFLRPFHIAGSEKSRHSIQLNQLNSVRVAPKFSQLFFSAMQQHQLYPYPTKIIFLACSAPWENGI